MMHHFTKLISLLYFCSSIIYTSHNVSTSCITLSNTIGQWHQAQLSYMESNNSSRPQKPSIVISQQIKTQNDDDNNNEPHCKQYDVRINQRTYLKRLIFEKAPRAKVKTAITSTCAQDLNEYNDHGQTFAHELTPIHWMRDILDTAIAQGLDVTKQSIAPDAYPGATLAHNIAGLLLSRRLQQYQDSAYTTNSLYCLHQLWKTDNGAHFNKLSRSSTAPPPRSVWNLLNDSQYLNEFLELLENHKHVPKHYKIAYRKYWERKHNSCCAKIRPESDNQ
ncbi:MAG TPA: hypothetical protein VLG50_02840 [Candidatus Saccharimonadales bacterium]|nr:hypothetical protein [Candidatus Saccharimonadales bacterium]